MLQCSSLVLKCAEPVLELPHGVVVNISMSGYSLIPCDLWSFNQARYALIWMVKHQGENVCLSFDTLHTLSMKSLPGHNTLGLFLVCGILHL